MTTEITRLALAVDTTDVKTASTRLDELAKAGAGAESAATAVVGALAKTNNTSAALGRTLGQQAQATKLTAYQTQQLSFQLHDLFVQVASGQSPLTALIQQGSQLSGTFGGIGGALRAVAGVFNPVTAGIAGVAAAIGSAALILNRGAEQSFSLERALVLTGNAAGLTEGSFNSLARSVATSTRTTIGSARESLQGLVESGRFSAESIGSAATAVQLLAKVSGESSESIVKDFANLAGNVTRGAATLNDKYHILTAAQVEQIRKLEAQGKTQQALVIVTDALSDRLQTAAGKFTTLGKAASEAKIGVSGFFDRLFSFGRTETPDEKVDQIRAAIELLKKSRNPADARLRERLEAQLRATEERRANEEATAKAAGENVKQQQAAAAFIALQNQYLTRQERMAEEIRAANALASAGRIDEADRLKLVANIRKKYADDSRQAFDNELADIQRRLQREQELYSTRNRFIDLANERNLLSVRDYFAARQASADEALRAELVTIDAEIAAARRRKNEPGADAQQRAEADGKIAAAVARRVDVERRAADHGVELALRQKQAQESLEQAFRGVEAARLDAQGRLAGAAAQRFDDQFKTLREKSAAEGHASAHAAIEALRQLTIQQAAFTEQATTAQDVLANLQIAEERVALAQRLGTTGELEGLEQVSEARQSAIAQLQAIVEAQEAIAKASGNPALVTAAQQARLELQKLEATADAVTDRFRSLFEDSLNGPLTDFFTKTKTASQAFNAFAKNVINDLARIAAQSASRSLSSSLLGVATELFSSLFGGSSGIVSGSSAESLTGAQIHGRHAAGLDYVPFDGYIAELHRGERVLTANHAQRKRKVEAAAAQAPVTISNTVVVQGDASENTVRLIRGELAKFAAKQHRSI